MQPRNKVASLKAGLLTLLQSKAVVSFSGVPLHVTCVQTLAGSRRAVVRSDALQGTAGRLLVLLSQQPLSGRETSACNGNAPALPISITMEMVAGSPRTQSIGPYSHGFRA